MCISSHSDNQHKVVRILIILSACLCAVLVLSLWAYIFELTKPKTVSDSRTKTETFKTIGLETLRHSR